MIKLFTFAWHSLPRRTEHPMGIRSEPFRGVVLSGDDIAKFEKQLQYHRPNRAAVATSQRGAKLVSEFKRTGRVAFVANRGKTGA